MEVQVSPEVANGITEEEKNKIAEIIKKNFENSKSGIDFNALRIVPRGGGVHTLSRNTADCTACDAGFTIAVAACALLGPFGATACIAAATVARAKCRDNNSCD